MLLLSFLQVIIYLIILICTSVEHAVYAGYLHDIIIYLIIIKFTSVVHVEAIVLRVIKDT